MKTELECVEEQLSELRMTQMRLESANFKDNVTPMVHAAIGKTYVYRNNSCGGCGKWDTFRKLLSAVFSEYHAWLIFEQCEVTADGAAKIETTVELVNRGAWPLPNLERGWEECAPEEYTEQRGATLRELSDPVRRREELGK